MIDTAWGKLNVDHTDAFKSLFVANSFDGSKHYLVFNRLLTLLGDRMVSFQKTVIESEIPTSLPAVIKNLVPPKG